MIFDIVPISKDEITKRLETRRSIRNDVTHRAVPVFERGVRVLIFENDLQIISMLHSFLAALQHYVRKEVTTYKD